MEALNKPGRMLLACSSSAVVLAALLGAQQASAHGYMTEPASRAALCVSGENKNCGAAQYEPQSVGEGRKGFPQAQGVEDGRIASGMLTQFAAMDVQTADRWHKQEITDRNIDFAWMYRAPHRTTKWEYFITQNGWNPNLPLSRAQFDPAPFCALNGHGELPTPGSQPGPGKEKHSCVIPGDKSGHHVILGVWTVDDTAGAFHNAVDVNIVAEGGPGEPVDGWSAVGTLAANQPLRPGDRVTARAFVSGAESAQFSVVLTIGSEEEGQPERWAMALAERINATQTLIVAGVRDGDGNIVPQPGVSNSIYAKPESGVTAYQLQIDMIEDTAAYMNVTGVAAEQVLVAGGVDLLVGIDTNREMDIEASVFDANNKRVGHFKQPVDASGGRFDLLVRSNPGVHHLTVVGATQDGRTSRQYTQTLEVTGEGGPAADFVYPDGRGSYASGMTVTVEGQVYECKPGVAAWCNSASELYYKPGTGFAWGQAWDLK